MQKSPDFVVVVLGMVAVVTSFSDFGLCSRLESGMLDRVFCVIARD